MDKATLTISLPRVMKDYITSKLREGRFSTPSEYIRSLIRDDQDLAATRSPTPAASPSLVSDHATGRPDRPRRKQKE